MGNREMRRVEERRRGSLTMMLAEVVPQATQYRGARRRRGRGTLEWRSCQIRTNRHWTLVSPTI